jgi:outer membrane protease
MTVENADLNLTTEQKKNPQRIELQNIAGYQQIRLKWIVKGGSKYTVRVESVKGGRAEARTE